MTDPSPPVADPSFRLAAARAAFAALQPRVTAGEPWALATAFGTEPEASWGPREVLAHTAEMLAFWLGEVERIVGAGGMDCGWGAGPAMRSGSASSYAIGRCPCASCSTGSTPGSRAGNDDWQRA